MEICLSKSRTWSWCTQVFENHWSTTLLFSMVCRSVVRESSKTCKKWILSFYSQFAFLTKTQVIRMPTELCEALAIIPTFSSLVSTPSSSCPFQPHETVLISATSNSNHDIQWPFFCQPSYFTLFLCCISQNCSFHPFNYDTACSPENFYDCL